MTGDPAPGFDPEQVTGWTLVRTYHVMARRFHRVFTETDLTPTSFGVLLHLTRNPGISQAALARSVLMTPQAMGELLRSLEHKGLIGRGGARLGRPTAVTLTDAGRRALRAAIPLVAAANQPVAIGLTARESATLNVLLHKVRRTLEAE